MAAAESASAEVTPSISLPVIAVLCLSTFLVSSSSTARAPFLLDMARDLTTTLPAVANLVSINAVSWGIASLVAGTISDRVGRTPIMLGALLTVGLSSLGFASAGSYALLVTWSLLGGFGGGAYMGTVFAAVSDRVESGQRGRALGWLITGQSLSLVLGAPLATLIGSLAGWRGASASQASATLALVPLVWLAVRGSARRHATSGLSRSASLQAVLNRGVLPLLVAGVAERICYVSMAVYMATYLLSSYGVSLQVLAVALVLVALGNLLGTTLGGQLADRIRSRTLLSSACLAVTALLAIPLLGWPGGLAVSVGLGFVYALVNAIGRPSLMAALSEVPDSIRGTVLGVNITAASLGWIGAASLGGWLIATSGFVSLGYLGATAGLLGAASALVAWRAGAEQNPARAAD